MFSRLWQTRASTRAAIVVERLWPLALPMVLVAALFFSFAWFGLFRLVPDWLRLGFDGFFGVAFLASIIPLTRFRRPGRTEIDRRIEQSNALAHAPVTAQTDRLSVEHPDGFANALWREHQKRMAAGLGALSGDLPRTGIPERDPWGLRAAVALLLVTAFAFTGSPFGGAIMDAFRAQAAQDAVPARIDAWVTPPSYTGRAPVFLTADGNRDQTTFSVPAGSDFAVRITGGGKETLQYMDASGMVDLQPEGTTATDGPPAASRQFSGKLMRDSALSLLAGDDKLRDWNFRVIPDKAPVVRFTTDPKRAVNGTLELAYEVEDDYGAVSGQALFAQDQADAPGARPLYKAPEMPLVLPRRGDNKTAANTKRDLTEHPWAGGTVNLTLSVTDAAGQEGRSEARQIVLPERPFSNPLARAVIEQRRMLALDTNSRPRVLSLMDAITLRPENTFDNPAHFLGISTARTQLKMAASDDDLRAVVDYMWEVALGIENGDLTAAERRLRQAQEALKQALENGASGEEIDKLMAELREAMQEFLREFAERSMQNRDSAQQMPQNGEQLRQSDLERMMDQIEEMAKSGARDKAQEMLSQLQDMMNNLQMGQQQAGRQGQNGQQSQMRQQMDQLGELMRRQQEMMNETFQMDQMQRGQRQRGSDRSEQRGQQGQQGQTQQGQQGQGQKPGENGQGRPMTPEEFADALKQLQQGQGQLRRDLQSLMDGLRGMGIKPGEGFGEAGDAMGQAEGALGEGEGEQAVGEQGRALEALRKGAQDMMQQMQQAMRGDQGGSGEGGRQQQSGRDPLGRPRATSGPDFGDSVKVPDEIDTQRAREILEAIRRRLGNALSPELERSYLERLLDLR